MSGEKIDDLLDSINSSSSVSRTLYTAFIALTGYIVISISSTTDMQIFEQSLLKLPLLNVDISLDGFYLFTPWIYLLIHANVLLVFTIISEKNLHFSNSANPRVHVKIFWKTLQI